MEKTINIKSEKVYCIPKPPNFLRTVGKDGLDGIDVSELSDEMLEEVGDAIKQEFIRRAKERRKS